VWSKIRSKLVVGANTDDIARTQRDSAELVNHQNRPILEQIMATPLTKNSIGSTHSSPSVPETQVVVGKSNDFCPILKNDLNLVRHILDQQNDDDNTPFLTYLSKKQKKNLNRSAYNTRSKGDVSNNPHFLLEYSRYW